MIFDRFVPPYDETRPVPPDAIAVRAIDGAALPSANPRPRPRHELDVARRDRAGLRPRHRVPRAAAAGRHRPRGRAGADAARRALDRGGGRRPRRPRSRPQRPAVGERRAAGRTPGAARRAARRTRGARGPAPVPGRGTAAHRLRGVRVRARRDTGPFRRCRRGHGGVRTRARRPLGRRRPPVRGRGPRRAASRVAPCRAGPRPMAGGRPPAARRGEPGRRRPRPRRGRAGDEALARRAGD